MRVNKKYVTRDSPECKLWFCICSSDIHVCTYIFILRIGEFQNGVDLWHVSLWNNETRGCKRRWHAPTSSLFLTALSREYPPEATLCLVPLPPLLYSPLPYPLATPLTRIVILSEYRNFPTARFRWLGGRRHFATYFACPLMRVCSKICSRIFLAL